MNEKEKPSQFEAPGHHPRLDRVSKTRKVLKVNFRGNRADLELCARFKAESLSEAVKSSDAAIDFLRNIETFKARDRSYLSEPIMIAIGTGGSRAHFFVANLGSFASVMERGALVEAFCFALGVEEAAARYFIKYKSDFEGLPCLGRSILEKATEIAEKKMKA